MHVRDWLTQTDTSCNHVVTTITLYSKTNVLVIFLIILVYILLTVHMTYYSRKHQNVKILYLRRFKYNIRPLFDKLGK